MGKMIYRYSLKSAVRHREGAESGPLSLYAHAFLAAPLGACHMARAGTDPHRRGIDVVGLPARLNRRKKPVSRIKCELYLGVPRHAAGFRIFSQGAYNEGRGNGAVSGRPWAPSVLRGGLRSAALEVGGDEKTPRLKEPGMIFDGRRVGR